MPWVRGGDTSATYPAVMRVAGLPGADDRSANEVMGFIFRLATQSSAHLTDYVVDVGTAQLFGGSRAELLVRHCKKVGLLTEVRFDGMKAYKIVEDPDFLHLRLKAEVEWDRQQQADGKNRALAGPVRLRDGDLCRYCGVMVMWRGRPSANSATFDHLDPGEAGTVDTVVVACRACNSGLRDIRGIERDEPKPPPTDPFYSEFTADYLTSIGYPVAATERPDIQPAPATRATRKKKTDRQRPDTQSGTAPSASDPAPAGHRAQPADPKVDLYPTSNPLSEAIGMDSAGSGRDGSGTDPPFRSKPNTAGTRRRKRSRRGAPS